MKIHFLSPLFALAISSLALSTFVGCSKKAIPTDNTTTAPSTTGVADAVPDRSYLWVHHKSVSSSLRYTHKKISSGTWADQCKVDLDETVPAKKDILCVTESTELDLWTLGMGLEFNVPVHEKCPYAVTMAPFFFQFEPPHNDSLSTYPHIPPAYVEESTNAITGAYSATAWYDTGKSKANPYFKTDSHASKYLCGFDYSDQEGPNCCSGTYNKKTTSTDSAGVTTVTNTEEKWGGSPGNCLAGPAMALNEVDSGHFPIIKIWRLPDQVGGLAVPIAVPDATSLASLKTALKNSLTNSNVKPPLDKPIAFESPQDLLKNFSPKLNPIKAMGTITFGSFDVPPLAGSTTRYLATYQAGTMAKAYSDILTYYDGSLVPGYAMYATFGDPRYFSVLCTDRGFEVTARIRLAIREWNTYPALKLATEPTAGEDNESGDESDYPEFPKHDFLDWADTIGWQGPWTDTNSDGIPDSYGSEVQNTYPGFAL